MSSSKFCKLFTSEKEHERGFIERSCPPSMCFIYVINVRYWLYKTIWSILLLEQKQLMRIFYKCRLFLDLSFHLALSLSIILEEKLQVSPKIKFQIKNLLILLQNSTSMLLTPSLVIQKNFETIVFSYYTYSILSSNSSFFFLVYYFNTYVVIPPSMCLYVKFSPSDESIVVVFHDSL